MLDRDDAILVVLPIVIFCILGIILIIGTFSSSTDKIVSQSNVDSGIKPTQSVAENNTYNISDSTNIIGDNNIVNITPVAVDNEKTEEATKESKESPIGYIPWIITGLLGALIVGYKVTKEVLAFKIKESEFKQLEYK